MPTAVVCEATPFTYLSLMSYAHQISPRVIGSVASATANTLVAASTAFDGTDYTGSHRQDHVGDRAWDKSGRFCQARPIR